MVKRIKVLLAILLLMMTMGGQASAGEKRTGEYPVTVMVVAAGDGSEAPEAVNVNPGDYFKVVLYASAGTGYGWNLEGESLVLTELVEHKVASASRVPLSGGPAKWEFYLRVKPEAVGQETLRFALQRPWERTEKPARLFDLTVVTGAAPTNLFQKHTVKVGDRVAGLEVKSISLQQGSLADITFSGEIELAGICQWVEDTGDGSGYIFTVEYPMEEKLPALKENLHKSSRMRIMNTSDMEKFVPSKEGEIRRARIVIRNYSLGERQIRAKAELVRVIEVLP